MTWLSKIEKRLKNLSKYRASWKVNAESVRMARVIRELAKYSEAMRELAVRHCGILMIVLLDDILSDDAKELVE